MPLFGEPARAPRDKREQGTTPATLGLASLLGDRRTLAIIAAVAGVVVLLGMVVMAASARDVTAAADAESAVRVGAMADASASVAVSAPADAGAPTEPAPSPAAASEVAGAQFLELKANAAVADVRNRRSLRRHGDPGAQRQRGADSRGGGTIASDHRQEHRRKGRDPRAEARRARRCARVRREPAASRGCSTRAFDLACDPESSRREASAEGGERAAGVTDSPAAEVSRPDGLHENVSYAKHLVP